MDEIAYVAPHLPSLVSWVRIKTRNKIDVMNDTVLSSPPQWYLNEVHRRLSLILHESFSALNNYVMELRLRFSSAYDTDARRNAVAYVEKERSLEKCIVKVDDFNRLVREINGMVSTLKYTLISKTKKQ